METLVKSNHDSMALLALGSAASMLKAAMGKTYPDGKVLST
jgi:hypothetical protein